MSVLLLTMGPQLGITAELPVVGVGGAGVIRFRAIGASGPVKWTLVDSTLPAEWDSALNPDGAAVTLTTSDAATAGTFSVTVRAVDSARIPVVRSFDVRVMALPLTISGAFPGWITGLPATGALTISGGVPPYSGLAITSGALPAGVTLALVGNQIVASGTPSVTGPWAATVQVSDVEASPAQISATGMVSRLWTPADLPVAPKIWLDWGSDITDTGGFAEAWQNRGSLGGVFSQAAPVSRPEIITGALNEKRILRFDGVNDGMSAQNSMRSIFRSAEYGFLFAVYAKRSLSSVDKVLFRNDRGGGFAGSRFAVQISSTSGPGADRIEIGARRQDNDSFSYLQSPSQYGVEWIILRAYQSWATGTAGMSINGSPDYTGATTSSGAVSNTDSIVPPTVGYEPSTGRYADIDLALLVVADQDYSHADRRRLEGWAAYQCGLQSKLPGDHPYRHTPPVVYP